MLVEKIRRRLRSLWLRLERLVPLPRPVEAVDSSTVHGVREPCDSDVAVGCSGYAGGEVLFVDRRTPTPDQDAGSVRTVAIIDELQRQGARVAFLPAGLTVEEPYASELRAKGVELLATPFVRSVRRHLKVSGHLYDVVILSRYPVAERYLRLVRRTCPRARLVFDSVDLHFLRERRAAELSGKSSHARRARKAERRELAVARACDVTWVTSDAERELLQDAVPNVDVQVVPTVYEGSAEGLPFDERSGLLFVGGFEHAPNVDAVLWFVREIWPAARKQLPPRVVLTIVGSKVPPEIFDLESPETNVVGHVPDLTEYFRRCRLSIAPLRFGAGLKGKVHQSLVRGLPCVTTTIGAEGLGLTSGENILIADDPDAFSRAVASLYQDRSSWERLAAAGRRHMEESFGLERVAAVVRDLLR